MKSRSFLQEEIGFFSDTITNEIVLGGAYTDCQ